MTETMAVGTKRGVKKDHGLFEMSWVTVWGAWVPEDWSPSLILHLDLHYGIEARAQGHTIQVHWDAEDPERIERVRDLIRDYGKSAWKRPLAGEAKDFFMAEAEALISAREARE